MAQYLNLKPVEFDKLSAKRKAAVKWEGRILLPKYDGCLALTFWSGGKLIAVRSRDNKAVKSMDHIAEDMNVKYPGLVYAGEVCIIGEAWNPGKEFAELSGTFRRQRPQPQLGFAPFDIVDWDGMVDEPIIASTQRYQDRLEWLSDARPVFCHVYPPTPVICENYEHAQRYARNCKDLGGYDGAIASDPLAGYTVSDGYGEFIKLKPLQSFSLEVLGVDDSIGEKTGRATASLRVRFKNGTCGVGTGFTNDQAREWVFNPASVVGRIAEVSCMGVYSGDGLMREPRFIGWRDDVTTPDY